MRFYMHRVIAGITDPSIKVDHKDHDSLNNQCSNLRACSNQQNSFNMRVDARKNRRSSSLFKGVSWKKDGKWWEARIMHNRKTIRLGVYKSELAAALAYNHKAVELFGEYACLNEVTQCHSQM